MRRRGTHVDVNKARLDQWEAFTVRLVQMQHEAMSIGLIRTGHKLNDAVYEVGWERAHFHEESNMVLDALGNE